MTYVQNLTPIKIRKMLISVIRALDKKFKVKDFFEICAFNILKQQKTTFFT